MRQRTGVEKKIFLASLLLVSAICAPLLLGPERGTAILGSALSFVTGTFGWLYLWFAVAVFGVLIWLAASKYGRVKFGDPDTRPEFSTPSWIAMIFTAGIGGELMYWGVIEWAYYYTDPPFGMRPESVEAGHWAAAYPLFHWGFVAWAIYCLPALPLAYAFHTRKHPTLRLSEACRGVLGSRVDGWVGTMIDVFFIFGLIGGVGTSLGLMVPIIAEGVAELTPLSQGLTLNAAIIVAWTALFGLSAYLGLQRGIKRLAQASMYIALALGVFILVVGPAAFILDTFTNSVGLLLQNFVQMSFYTDPIGNSSFPQTWTIFYWGWWIAYAPFLGLFTARISRGRTVREMILAMLVAGSLGCWVSFAVLTGTSLSFELNNVVPVTDILNESGAPAAVVAVILGLPLGPVALVAFLILVMIFLATTLDSSAWTMASVASRELHPDEEPARWHRLFWAIVLGAVAIAMMAAGGLEPLQTLSIITAFPLIFVLSIVALSFRRWLIEDRAEINHVETTEESQVAEDGASPHHQREREKSSQVSDKF